MFIKIKENRIKISSIGEYEYRGKSSMNNQFYIYIKVSGKIRNIGFSTEKECESVLNYLDKVLNVKAI